MEVLKSRKTTEETESTRSGLTPSLLHLWVLSSFAIAQPLFDLLSGNAEFFVVRRSEPIDVVLLTFILLILVPLPLALTEIMAGMFGLRARAAARAIWIVVLITAILMAPLKRMAFSSDMVPAGLAILMGVVAMGIYFRFDRVRFYISFLWPALLIFPLLFLLNSSISKIVLAHYQWDPSSFQLQTQAPIVMLVLDELPTHSLMDGNRRIDSVRYPNLAALVSESYWFRNATTVADHSANAVTSILTGNYPSPGRLPTLEDNPRNLFTWLGGTHRMEVFETVSHLCPDDLLVEGTAGPPLEERMRSLLSDLSIVYLHTVLPEMWTRNLPAVTRTWGAFMPPEALWEGLWKAKNRHELIQKTQFWERPRLFREFVASIDSTQEPTLFFLNLLFPHLPWEYLPTGERYPNFVHDGLFPDGQWTYDSWAVNQNYQRHLMQTGFLDLLIGELIARLRATDLYDRSLIVITSDHGVSFRPNDSIRDLSETNYPDIMPVPLIIKVPGQTEGVLSDRNVQTIDILPTLAEMLDVTLPWPVDGHSAIDPSIPENDQKVTFQSKNPHSGDSSEFQKLVKGPRIPEQSETLERKLALFGSGTQAGGPFAMGPHPELMGRHLDDITVAGPTDVTIDLDDEELFANVQPSGSFVPVRIRGLASVPGQGAPALTLAVAVNGIIQAATHTLPAPGPTAIFSAMVPANAFRPGSNQVEVFVISVDSEENPTLLRPG